MTSRLPLCRAAKEGGPGGNVRVPFLSPFLCGMTKKWHPCGTAHARSWVRVKRSSCLKFSFLSFGAPQCGTLCGMLLLGLPQEVAKKGTKGSGTPWHPAVRLCERYALAPRNTTQKQTVSAFALAFSRKTPTRKQHARRDSKSSCYRSTRLAIAQIFSKTESKRSCFPRLPLVVACAEAQH